MQSRLKKILFPFIFILAFCAICATVLVGFIIYTHDKDNPVTPELVEKILQSTSVANDHNAAKVDSTK